VKTLSDEAARLRGEAREAEAVLNTLLAEVPNVPDDDVPASQDPGDNVVMREHLAKP